MFLTVIYLFEFFSTKTVVRVHLYILILFISKLNRCTVSQADSAVTKFLLSAAGLSDRE